MRSTLPISLLASLAIASTCGLSRLRAQELNEKAARILEPLTKRPGSGPLFERFVNAWLDTGTLESLGQFLAARVKSDPSAPNRLLLALFFSRQGEPVKALEEFRAALETNPGSADVWYQKALLESRTLDFDAAVASLGKCLAAKPAGELAIQAPQLLGRLHARSGKTEAALQVWRELLDARPEDEALREDILELQIAESLWPAALETAAKLVEITVDPYRRVIRRMRLGDVHDRSGQRDKALETFAACLEDAGAGSWLEKEILSQIEKLFRREDDMAGLKEYYQKLVEKHRHRAGLQRAMARLLMETGEPDAAIAAGRALMELSPGDRAVREEFIALLTTAGRAADAIPQVEQLLKQKPDDLELRLSLAELKHTAKDRTGALAELQAWQKSAGPGEATALRLAGILDRYGMAPEAEATLRGALEAAPEQPEIRLMLASQLHKSGRKDEALAEWMRAAEGATLPLVQQAARAMQAHGESDGAWKLMLAAAPRGASDPVFLAQLCTMADKADRAAAVLPQAQKLVELAKTAPDLNSALDTVERIVRLTGGSDALAAELSTTASTAQSLCLLATLREGARDTSGAGEALEKAKLISPELALSQLVRLWTMRGDFARAAEAAETLFNSQGGRQGHVAESIASLHLRAGNSDAALRWTQEWKKLMPGAAAPVLSEARLLEADGREEEAFSALRSAAGRFEGNTDIRARLASMSLESGRTADALRLYNNLYEDAPDLTAKMRWLQPWGEAAQAAGRLDALIAQFEDRRRESRDSAAPLLALAELHRIADNYEGRRNALTEAARIKPGDPEIAMEIARLESREDNDEAAMQTLRTVVAKDSSGRAAALLSEMLLRNGREEEGLQLLRDNGSANPGSVESTTLTLARRGDEKAALAFLQPHLLTWPADWRLGYLAALLEIRNDLPDEAAARLLTLAAATSPLARTASTTPLQSSGQTYEEMVVQIMPADIQGFFRLLLATSVSGQNSGRQAAYTSLPWELEELRDRSAAMLLDLARTATPEKRALWTGELERRGFSAAGFLPDLPPVRRFMINDRGDEFSRFQKSHPGSRELLALAALNGAYRNWQEPADAAIAATAWEAFSKTAPRAALYFALPGAGLQEKTAPWEEEVIAAAEAMDKAPPLLLLAAVRSLGLTTEDEVWAKNSKMTPEWRRRLFAILQRWQQAQDAAGIARGFGADLREYVFAGLASAYVKSGSAAQLAALLDAEWRWQSQHSPSIPGSTGEENLTQPVGFPPDFLPGLEESLLRCIQRTLTVEMAAKILPLLNEPVLRVMAAARVQGQSAGELLTALQSALPGSAVPFILAAGWQEKNGNYAAAAEQAVKALYLPVSQEVRRRLDGALAWWASKKGKPGDALHSAGREAALRLRRDAVTDERRAELASLMDTLGLSAEADRLMRQGEADESLTAGTPMERAEKLLLDGKRKEALPLLLSELRSWTRLRLSNGSFMPDRDSLAEWRSLVQVHGLMPDVMSAVQHENATPAQTAEFGIVCELTGNLEQAKEAYGKAFAAGQRKKLPLLLFRLVVKENPDRAVELIHAMPDGWTETSLRACLLMAMDAENHRVSVTEQLKFAAFLGKLIAALPAGSGPDFPVRVALETCGGEASEGELFTVSEISEGSRISPMITGSVPEEEKARVETLVKERAAVFEQLCRQLLTIPGCGLQAWQHWREAATTGGGNASALVDDGLKVLAAELKRPKTRRRQDGQNADAEVHNVVTLLMQDAAAAGRTADFASQIVPAVTAARSPLSAARLLRAWPLYEASPDNFPEVARTFLEKNGAKSWEDVTAAAVERKTGAGLAGDFLKAVTDTGSKDAPEAAGQFGAWCALLEQLGGRAAAEAFFLQALNEVAGPADKRASVFGTDKMTPQAETLQTLLSRAIIVEAWTGPVLRWVRDELMPFAAPEVITEIEDSFSDSTLSSAISMALRRNGPSAVGTMLAALPVSEDATTFYGGGKLLLDAALQLRALPPDGLASTGFGGDRNALTFGRQFILGVSREWTTGMCNQMAPWQGRIEALPEPQRGRVLHLMRRVNGILSANITPAGAAFHNWLFSESLTKSRKELDQSIAAFLKDAEEGAIPDADELSSRIANILHGMADSRDARGRQVIAAACRVEQGFNDGSTASGVIEALMEYLSDYRDRPTPRNSAWVLALMAEALRAGAAPGDIYDWQLGNGASGVMNDDDDSVSGGLTRLVELMGPLLKPGEARLFMAWTVRSLGNGNSTARNEAEALQWIASEGSKSPHGELIRELDMALQYVTAKDSASTPPAVRDHFLALLRDTSLPVTLRLSMGASLIEMNGVAELAGETARLLLEALTARLPVTQEQEAQVFHSLADVPRDSIDGGVIKSLISLTSLARLREDADGYTQLGGLAALLDFSLSAGEAAITDRLLGMKGRFPNRTALTILARRGEKERLAKLISANPEITQEREGPTTSLDQWDRTLEAALPAALEGIADPSTRFEVQALLTSSWDESGTEGITPIKARLDALAPAFTAMAWRSPELETRVLYEAFLNGRTPLATALWPALEASLERVPLNTVPFLSSEIRPRFIQLHAARLRLSAARGELKPLTAALAILKRQPMVDDDTIEEIRQTLIREYCAAILEGWEQLGKETKAALCESWRALLLDSDSRQWGREWIENLRFAQAIHGLAGETDALGAWHDSLGAADKAVIRSRLEESTPKDFMESYNTAFINEAGSPESRPEKRKALFMALAASPLGGGPGYEADEAYLRLSGAEAAEFLALESTLCQARPDNAWLVFAFVRAHAAAGNWAGVLERTTAALAKEKPATGTVWAPLLEYHNLALEKSGRPPEGIEALRALPAAAEGNGDSKDVAISNASAARLRRRYPAP